MGKGVAPFNPDLDLLVSPKWHGNYTLESRHSKHFPSLGKK
jgi:hypothetical protein